MQTVSHNVDMPSLPTIVIELYHLAETVKKNGDSERIMQRRSFGQPKDISVCVCEKNEDLMKKLANIGDLACNKCALISDEQLLDLNTC